MIVKVCGMTDPDNIRAVAALPIDALGFIFYKHSPRNVGKRSDLLSFLQSEEGQALRQQRVGVFVNEGPQTIVEQAVAYGLNAVQLHGNETPADCIIVRGRLDTQGLTEVQLLKAIGVGTRINFAKVPQYAKACDYLLWDTKSAKYGGTGRSFDWSLLNDHAESGLPYLLSGGIGPDHAEAIQALEFPQLRGIDLNSRFETAPGMKSPELLQSFLERLGRSEGSFL